MISKIKILPPELANKIAAGEVVQRPASVVKELIENSIDANATRINIVVKDGGKSFIQITDNGEGMSELDASLAFKRHATSKILSSSDLEKINTLGFRGEALASISAVSQVEMKTRSKEDDLATLIRIEGDVIKEKTKTAYEQGTSIIVRNLFYNTPARRNFLKSKQTELKNITDVIIRMSLAFPEIEWSYVSDSESILDLKPKPIEARVMDIYGKSEYDNMIQFNEQTDLMSIAGFLSKPNYFRKSRTDQLIFLNRRFIFNKMINHAVYQAYGHLLEKGKFPFFILFLSIDVQKVDVNVHPSKLEVKFSNDSEIYKMILSTLRKVLVTNDFIPSVSFQQSNDDMAFEFNKRKFEQDLKQISTPVLKFRPLDNSQNILLKKQSENNRNENVITHIQKEDETNQSNQNVIPSADTKDDESIDSKPVWQIHNKYIISQIRDGLLIVDQHVAHERIIYEKVLDNFQNSLPSSQQLLFPETIEISISDYALVKELMPHLNALGFDIRLFGKNTVIMDGIPSDVRVGNERKILQEVLDEYKNNENAGIKDIRDNLAKSFACKAAIKAGDRLNTTEMISLIEHLFLTKMPYVCPHGRPIIIRIPLEELDKRFGRT